MSNLDKLYLMWFMVKNKTLEFNVEYALAAWNRRQETRDYIPEAVIFNTNQDDVTVDEILGLKVKKSDLIQKNYLYIQGDLSS